MKKQIITVLMLSSAVTVSSISTADVEVYGRINNAITIDSSKDSNTSKDGKSIIDLQNVGSRFGVRAKTDISHGLTATGHYEFATRTDRKQKNLGGLRIGTVGISGRFGAITVGNQWSAFFNSVGGELDPSYNYGGLLYSSMVGGPYRSSNTIKYSTNFNPVHLEFDIRLNGSDESSSVADTLNGNGYGVGIRFDATKYLTLAAAMDNEMDTSAGGDPQPGTDTTRMGVSARISYGNLFTVLGYHKIDVSSPQTFASNQTQIWVGADINTTTLMLGFGETASSIDKSDEGKANAIVLGAYHDLGKGLKLYYEGVSFDGGDDAVQASGKKAVGVNKHMLGMRIDF